LAFAGDAGARRLMLVIRPATSADAAGIWSILEPEIRGGETFALPQNMLEADALNYWRQPDHETLVAGQNGQILGSYYLRANQQGGGGHVANAGYLTAAAARGRGVARAMLEDSLERAKVRGFAAMQFNFVVSSNERALKTWEAYGFRVVGRLPLAFRHPTLGLIDALVMYKDLKIL
jgi:ribosomal protein S18 acetylase RimI-like enzyme